MAPLQPRCAAHEALLLVGGHVSGRVRSVLPGDGPASSRPAPADVLEVEEGWRILAKYDILILFMTDKS